MKFLPVSTEDIKERNWDGADFVLVTGDAYMDHPTSGTAIISRVLEAGGYKVAILPQPDFKSCEDFKRFGRPKLGFLINSGNVDSMVNNFSVFLHRRKKDEYSPGGKAGRRPDRAVIVYANRAREAYKDVPIIIGGIESSLRRMGHYDYWENKVRRSILLDSKADLLIYGMGERAVVEIAEALESGISVKDIKWIRGTCHRENINELQSEIEGGNVIKLPSFAEISTDKTAYAKSFAMQYRNNDCINGETMAEPYENGICVVQNPPQPPLEREELDDVYSLPYCYAYHPMYEAEGGIPAIKEVEFSLVSSRGCFGGCSFCAITFHQGREVRSRSREAIAEEAKSLVKRKGFKGYIHDVGGPTANFRNPSCRQQLKHGMCKHKDCLYPKPCKNMDIDHSDYIKLLKELRSIEGVKKVFVRSGIRYDYVMADKSSSFIEELCKYHVSGILKVAPEHVSRRVLDYMKKPSVEVFDEFCSKYAKTNLRLGMKQYLLPYLISSHPGSTMKDAVELALYLKKYGFVPDQVQDFYPTPGTLATCMYYTETDPFTEKPVYVAKNMEEKKMQRALIHFNKKENRALVEKALKQVGREDLIDYLLGRVNGNQRGKGAATENGKQRGKGKAAENRKAMSDREGSVGKKSRAIYDRKLSGQDKIKTVAVSEQSTGGKRSGNNSRISKDNRGKPEGMERRK